MPGEVSRQRRHQIARRKAGLCAVEGCMVVTGRRHYCMEHRKQHRQDIHRRHVAKRERLLEEIRAKRRG